MRPVEKGAAPAAAYANYAAALPDLEQRLGRYCSYCERYIATNLAVEHVQPKSLVPALALTWSNFLLACVNCNSCKGDTPVTVTDYLWPDNDNTLRAFEYRTGGVVALHSTLAAPVRAKAQASAALVGLDRVPGGAIPPTQSDLRWRTVFAVDANMRSRLRAAFVGTCSNSFDASGNLQARPGGQL